MGSPTHDILESADRIERAATAVRKQAAIAGVDQPADGEDLGAWWWLLQSQTNDARYYVGLIWGTEGQGVGDTSPMAAERGQWIARAWAFLADAEQQVGALALATHAHYKRQSATRQGGSE